MSATPDELELSWPLPGELGRRWARRLRRQVTLVLALIGAGLVGLAGLAHPGADPVARWGDMAVWTAGVLVIAPLLAAVSVGISARFLRAWAREVVAGVEPALEPGERVLGAVAVVFPGQGQVQAWWILTDRRSLLFRLVRALGLAPVALSAPLCAWPEVERVELVRRDGGRAPLPGELLRLLVGEQGLRLRARDGRAWFLGAEAEVLEALVEWLRGRGIPLEEVEDLDLIGSVPLTPVVLGPPPARPQP